MVHNNTGDTMLRKNAFYICLIIIYLLVLTKDHLLNIFTTPEKLTTTVCSAKTQYYEQEYNRLSNFINLKPFDYEVIYSRVITRNIYDFFEKITITKGYNDNIKVGSLVLNEFGLIGLVAKTYSDSSEVALLTNPHINLSVKIGSAYGIMEAKDTKIIVKNIKLNHEINIGDKVYTSGLTDIPANILIGTVKDIKKDTLDLEYLITLDLAANLEDLKYVGVLP